MTELPPVHVSSPGEIIRDELAELKITSHVLAAVTKRDYHQIDGIIDGTVEVTASIADDLARFFHTSPELWLSLESNYRKHLETSHD
jgi:addiction module HigA family antidote